MAVADYVSNAPKAMAAGGSVLVAGALTKIVVRIIATKWPSFVDPDITDAIDTVLVAIVAYIGAYVPAQPVKST
jgi:hypothetical protein